MLTPERAVPTRMLNLFSLSFSVSVDQVQEHQIPEHTNAFNHDFEVTRFGEVFPTTSSLYKALQKIEAITAREPIASMDARQICTDMCTHPS
jgi:hypothetical protein